MTRCKIEKGGVYANANEFLAREVIEITPGGDVLYNDYALSDGAPFGRQCRCSLGTFIQWAARPLTSEETCVLRREEGEFRDRANVELMTRLGIAAASDELIRREFYRRGLHRLTDSGQRTTQPDESGDPPGADTGGSPGRRAGRPKKLGNGRGKSRG